MKKFLIFCIILAIILGIIFIQSVNFSENDSKINTYMESIPVPPEISSPTPTVIITRHKNLEDQQLLWDFLNKYTENEYIAAGILGYFWRESSGKSNSCAGWYINDVTYQTDTCKEFTEKIDQGLHDSSTLEEFIEWSRYHYGGYGLGQWCTINGLTELYNFAKEWNTSIGDAEMQCAFTVYHIQNFRSELWNDILNLTDPALVGYKIGVFYDGSSYGAGYIGQLAQQFYNIYHRENNYG